MEVSFVALDRDAARSERRTLVQISKELAEDHRKYGAIWADSEMKVVVQPIVSDITELWINGSKISKDEMMMVKELGFKIDLNTGRLIYSGNFIPLRLSNDTWLIRHGETYINASQEKRFQGQANKEQNQLTENGKLQAREAAEELCARFSDDINQDKLSILISPLDRAKETAAEFLTRVRNQFFKELVPINDPGLKEINFGEWENLAENEIKSHFGDEMTILAQKYRAGDVFVKASSGESFIEFLYRVKLFMQNINKKYMGKRVILFGHGTFLKALQVLTFLKQFEAIFEFV